MILLNYFLERLVNMNKRRISVQFLLYFLMLMFLMVTVGCSKSNNAAPPTTYTVTFDSQGGTPTPTPITLTSNAAAGTSFPTPPTNSGSTFGGWWTKTGGSGREFTANTPVTADITVHAYWSSNPVYIVTYDTGVGGPDVGIQHVTAPVSTVAALPPEPTMTGFNFGGWYKGTSGTGEEFTSTTSVTKSITVHAFWSTSPIFIEFCVGS